MSKIIIHNQTELSDVDAIQHVLYVIGKGKVSETKRGKQYCFATVFTSGIVVTCNRLGGETYTFHVKKERS